MATMLVETLSRSVAFAQSASPDPADWATKACGPKEARTPDPLNAIQVLSQLSYRPRLPVSSTVNVPATADHSGLPGAEERI